MLILGLETSCDETSASVIDNTGVIFSNIISSQIDVHKKFGGVVPELAGRRHLANVTLVIEEAVQEANVSLNDIQLIAVTKGPGLVGALLVGISLAKSLAYALKKPLVGVNHIEGHIFSAFLSEPTIPFPSIALVASGGHTHLYLVKGFCDYELLGKTRDDAVGEAFDKAAKMMKLGYPGGPIIEKEARSGNPEAIFFPRAYLSKDSLDFSFSGVKTSVRNYLLTHDAATIQDVAASFQASVVEVLTNKLLLAATKYSVTSVLTVGGVSANNYLRESIQKKAKHIKITSYTPHQSLCGDNAAMIAYAGYHRFLYNNSVSDPIVSLDAEPRMKL